MSDENYGFLEFIGSFFKGIVSLIDPERHNVTSFHDNQFFFNKINGRGNIMSLITYRAFTRHKHQSPIVFSDHSQREYETGEMINISDGGMVFLTEHKLKPGDTVDIKILEDTPDPAWLRPNRDYTA